MTDFEETKPPMEKFKIGLESLTNRHCAENREALRGKHYSGSRDSLPLPSFWLEGLRAHAQNCKDCQDGLPCPTAKYFKAMAA